MPVFASLFAVGYDRDFCNIFKISRRESSARDNLELIAFREKLARSSAFIRRGYKNREFLSTLDKQAKELTERINELEMQFIQVKHELEKGDEYACKIAELTEKLNETDKTLGLEKTPVL